MTDRPKVRMRATISFGGPPSVAQPAPAREPKLAERDVDEELPCVHRGEQIREEINRGCQCVGGRYPVHACALFGECAPRKFHAGQTVRGCSTCEVMASPDD